jgi:hypothetical protein
VLGRLASSLALSLSHSSTPSSRVLLEKLTDTLSFMDSEGFLP